jgi:beta-mannosidase
MHVWDVYFGGEAERYRTFRPRFCSEFGFQGPATYATLAEAVGAENLRGSSPQWISRQKSNMHLPEENGEVRNHQRLTERFNPPDCDTAFNEWHFLLSLNQARSVDMGVQWFRSLTPHCSGTLYWNLNDCWPGNTWSCVDYAGRYKLLWYATRRFYADRLLTIQPAQAEGPPRSVIAHNDHDEPWRQTLRIARVGFDGRVHAETETAFTVEPRACAEILAIEGSLAEPQNGEHELLRASSDTGEQAWWYWRRDMELAYPEPHTDVAVWRQSADRLALTVTARTFIRDLCVFVDRLDPAASVSDQMVSLLPGESTTFGIHTRLDLPVHDLTNPPVMQCANRFGASG